MITIISPHTTPPPESMRKLSNSTQIDLNQQSTFVFGQQPVQGLFIDQTSSTSPLVGGNSQYAGHPHEMIYTSPFSHPGISSPPYATPNAHTQPTILHQQQQQSALMMPPFEAHQLSTTQLFQQPNNRSQSLTLLPTTNVGQACGQMSGHAGQHQFTSHTPPPMFPANTPAVDLNSLLLGNNYFLPNQQHINQPSASSNSSPPVNNSLGMNLPIYAGLTDRSSPRSFPKPPIPPSSPSIKEKRRQQAQMKTPSYKEPSSSPNGSQTG